MKEYTTEMRFAIPAKNEKSATKKLQTAYEKINRVLKSMDIKVSCGMQIFNQSEDESEE